jgi:hypothetical protein
VEYFNYLGSLTTSAATDTRKIKFRIAMAKATVIKNENIFFQQIELTFKEETNEELYFEHSLAWC